MRILVCVDQLQQGGAGRVASIMINGLVERGHDVVVATDCSKGVFYKINAPVEPFFYYSHKGKLSHVVEFFKWLQTERNIVKRARPEVIITYIPNIFLLTKLSTLFMNIPVVASDHTSMGRRLDWQTNMIRFHLYGLADSVTILTEKDARLLGKKFPRKLVVYNPLTFDPAIQMASKQKTILCAGRVSAWEVKGFDRIIKIWGGIAHKYPDWSLKIAGAGNESDFEILKAMADDCGITDRVTFLGQVSDMKSLYMESAIFALPSRVEGFPMVLIEAMSQGCAVVSFSMQGAVKEIVNDGRDGFIVGDGDVPLFSDKIEYLINSSDERQKMAREAMKNVQKFSKVAFLDKWERLLGNVLNK